MYFGKGERPQPQMVECAKGNYPPPAASFLIKEMTGGAAEETPSDPLDFRMEKRPKTLRLILGDQLNDQHSWYRKVDREITYVLMEVMQEATYVTHHIQKVAAFFAGMREFARQLREKGHHVIYTVLDDPENRQCFSENIQHLIDRHHFQRFEYQLPDEYRLDQQLGELTRTLTIPSAIFDSEHFLTARQDVKDFFAGKKRFLMESFYRHMRKKYQLLMDGEKPVGGQWNYDIKNRQRYDEKVPIPEPRHFENNVQPIVKMLDHMRVPTIGEIDSGHSFWPKNGTQARALLQHFVSNGLPFFGRYQDAMTTRSVSLFHSRLSFALNTKMLHPLFVIKAAIRTYENTPDRIGIEQVEGFVRQILGWREYMRGLYWHLMPEFEFMNYFNHTNPLPAYYWTADTQMNCLKHAIDQSLTHAYAHHIQRLMVTGNFALLAGVAPREVDAWYLGIYSDAVQWVELPNTLGMSQYADGGIIATKPYVSSARYIHNMSDYCGDCQYNYKEPFGDRSCPFNSMFWGFLNRHRNLLQKNPRIGMMYRTWDRMNEDRQNAILKQAKQYLSQIDNL
jgi:deoxyribodipyrimidine photolyase-related protein